MRTLAWIIAAGLLFACARAGEGGAAGGGGLEDPDAFVAADSERILEELRFLSSDALRGRRTGEPGNAQARDFILKAFREAGLRAPEGGFVQAFEFRGRRDTTQVVHGANVVGFVPGTEAGLGSIVLTAHFDHLGVRPPRPGTASGAEVDSIYNGADDNASGTVALLSLARYLVRNPPRHKMVFAALDGEEMGLRGARAFLASGWPGDVVLNVNLDMVSRSDSLLFAAGPSHHPRLRPILENVAGRPPVVLRLGHDRPGVPGVGDWTRSSDHAVFHEAGIPFVYFGVEGHADNHRPSDEFERVDPLFFVSAVKTVLAGVLALDETFRSGGLEPEGESDPGGAGRGGSEM
jgi:hypothetical protein